MTEQRKARWAGWAGAATAILLMVSGGCYFISSASQKMTWTTLLMAYGVVILVGLPSYIGAGYFGDKGWNWLVYPLSAIAYILGLAGFVVTALLAQKVFSSVVLNYW